MSRALLFIVLLLNFVHAFGQATDTIVYTFEQLIPVGNNDLVVLSVDNKERPTKLYLKYVDTTYQVLAEKRINLNRRGVRGQLESVFYWGGKLNVLSSLYYPGPKRNHLIFTQYELPSLKEGGAKKIDEAYTPGAYRIPFGYSLSPDSTQILFYSWSYALPEDPARLSLHVLDKDLRLQWQKYYLLPFKNESLYIHGCQLSNEGKAYILCENYEGKVTRNMTPKKQKIKYFALMMEPNGGELRIYPFDLEERIIDGLEYEMGRDEVLYVGGIYRKLGKKVADGAFLFRVNGKSKKLTRKLYPIDKVMYDKAYTSTKVEMPYTPKNDNLFDYTLDEIHLGENGNLYLIAEKRPGHDPNRFTYDYNDILVFKISPRQTLDWLVRIPKRQRGYGRESSLFSYAFFEKKDQLYFLFNDTKANNANRNAGQKLDFYIGKETINVAVRIKEDGSWVSANISPLLGGGQRPELIIFPLYCWSLKDRLLLYGEKNVEDKFSGYFLTLKWRLLGQ